VRATIQIIERSAILTSLALFFLASSALAQLTITGTNQIGNVPFTPAWIAGANSLISGLVPTTATGNFGEYTGATTNNLTKPGIPLTIYAYNTLQATNLEVCGNDGVAGSLLVYTLPASTYGYNVTNITVYGGWQDNGRDSQAYTISYSTAANPASFVPLTQVSYSPSGVPNDSGSANRVIINNLSGAAIINNAAILKFDFTAPPSENGAVGYTAITVQGTAATNFGAQPIVITTSNQNSGGSFTPNWNIETDSLIAGQLPSIWGAGNFTIVSGTTGISALTEGAFGNVGIFTNYAMCGSNAGQSVTYNLSGATLTNIVVYSGWQNNGRDGQFYNILYSTLASPGTFLPLVGVSYNPAITGFSANRVAITTSTGQPLATNVAFVEFDFTPQVAALDGGYSGYAKIILEGSKGSPPSPILGSSPIPEPYPYVSTGGFSGPAVPLSPDPLVAYRWPNPQASDGLQIYMLKPKTVTADTNSSFVNLQSLTGTNPYVTVQGLGSIEMDFGQENAAWLEFDSPDFNGSVEMSISEYNAPEIIQSGPKTAVPIKYGNTYRLELNSQLYEGVRFGWIQVTSYGSPWHITGLRLVCQNKPANYNGSFSCSDPMLTRIWYTGAYTVKLNLESNYFGAILVDRGDRIAWTGDDHCAQAAALAAFGNYDFIKESIDGTANNNNGIASYGLYWVLSLIDYYNYTGDATELAGYITSVEATLDGAYAAFGTNPGLGFYGWDERLGAGFENPDCAEAESAYEMLSIESWNLFAAAMGKYGRADLQAKYSGYASQKLAALRQNPAWYRSFSLHACADAANTGLLNNTELNAMFAQEFTDRVNRVSFSGFNQYYVIQAFAAMDKYDDALSSINDLWGGEINYGGTTFFEVSRPSWSPGIGTNDPVPECQCGWTSLCHPWSAGVVKWISEEVLGIKPTSPGFAKYQIIPHLGRTLTYVSGQMPTPLGNILASFNVSNGLCSVSAPAGTVGTVGIPKVEKSINIITVNGTLAWDGAFHPVAGMGGASQDSEFVYFSNVQSGTYSISVSYSGSTPSYNEPAVLYAARFINEDLTTSGNWGGVYGKDGYVLCNYNGNGSDKSSLPSYVSSVVWSTGVPSTSVWTNGTTDTRALASSSSNQSSRNATCYYTSQDMPFIINCTGTSNHQIALYFVDWDNKGRRLAVEMFDANSLNLIAPVEVVTNYVGGKYLVYTYTNSVKFRIDQVRGDNAVLSGIFFDPAPANTAPVLGVISNQYLYAGQPVQFTATATDAQSAYQTLAFSLSNAPAGASINPSTGAFSWVTTNAAAPSTNSITVYVTDNGLPPLSAAKTFSVFVYPLPQFTGATAGTNGQIQLMFNTLPGQNYQVQFKVQLTDANWTPLGALLPGTGSPTIVSDNTSTNSQRFYRLQAMP